jgi:hypothetical protein
MSALSPSAHSAPCAAASCDAESSVRLAIDAYMGSSIFSLEFDVPCVGAGLASIGCNVPMQQIAAAAVVAATLPEPLIEPCINAAVVAISTAVSRMQLAAETHNSTPASLPSSDAPQAATPPPDPTLEFGSCFRALCCRRESAIMIAQVTKSYAMAIQEAHAQCALQLAALHETQQKEFSRSVLKNPLQRQEVIETMARAHAQKKKQIIAFWKDEISQLKSAQRQEFRDFVVQQYEACCSSFASLYDPDEPFVKAGALQLWVQQRDNCVWTGDLLAGNRQLGKMLSICVRSGSVGDCYGRVRAEEQTQEAQVDCMQLLYSHASLAAVHYLSIDGSHRSSAAHRDMVDACEASCEFHFSSYPDQIAAARAAMQGEFSAGDCLITRHSNLRALHLLFHCMVETVAADRWVWSRSVHAETVAPFIGKVVQFCCAQGIQSLAIPAFSCDNVAKLSPVDAADLLAATLKSLRSSFVEFSQQSHVTFLREVHVVMPPAVVQMLGKDGIVQLISRTIMQ